MTYNEYIDHTLLRADATEAEINKLCDEAKQHNFMSVCINPHFVSHCRNQLRGSKVKVCTVIGFPLGSSTTKTKMYETKNALKNGADEIDMVLNISNLKAGMLESVTDEIKKIKRKCGKKVLKVIVETCLLNENDKINACQCVINGGADFIKTSTGFSTGGATLEDIKLFKQQVCDKVLIKASGGVKSYSDMVLFINAGANRIGTSKGVSLVTGAKGEPWTY